MPKHTTAYKESFIIPTLKDEARLSDYLVGKFASIQSKKGVKKAIEQNRVLIDGRIGRTSTYVKGGETIQLKNELRSGKPTINLKIKVWLEDEHLAIVEKPAGVIVSGNKKRTLENGLPSALKPSTEVDALGRPEPIHRLDYATSGLLLIGKTRSTVIKLNKLFEERTVEKTYLAVTSGEMQESGSIENEIKGKKAITTYQVLASIASDKYNKLNLVKLLPATGRKHQLRIHMADMGNPILGDKQYGSSEIKQTAKGLFLHAYQLKFLHPITGEEVNIKNEIPKKFDFIVKDVEGL